MKNDEANGEESSLKMLTMWTSHYCGIHIYVKQWVNLEWVLTLCRDNQHRRQLSTSFRRKRSIINIVIWKLSKYSLAWRISIGDHCMNQMSYLRVTWLVLDSGESNKLAFSQNFDGLVRIKRDSDSLWTFLMKKKWRKKDLIQSGRPEIRTPSPEFANWISKISKIN